MSYEDRKSTWNSGVRKAIRRGSAEQEVRKHRDHVTGAWKQISQPRPRVDVSYDLDMVTALRQTNTDNCKWIHEERFEKTCIKQKEQNGGTHQPLKGKM